MHVGLCNDDTYIEYHKEIKHNKNTYVFNFLCLGWLYISVVALMVSCGMCMAGKFSRSMRLESEIRVDEITFSSFG